MQTKWGSLVEALTGVVVGFALNFLCNWVFLPMVGAQRLTFKQNFLFGCIMTVISIGRSYGLRRGFNALKRFNKETPTGGVQVST